MTHLTLRRGAAIAMLMLPCLTGCGADPAKLVPVRGKIVYRGKPLHSGTVVFTPDPRHGSKGPQACASIQADGRYVLRTGTEAGAVSGWHRVTVLAVEPVLTIPVGQRYAVPRSLLPSKFSDPELSGIIRQVSPGRENVIDLDLDGDLGS